jgi:hypothetical protein
MDDTIGLDDVCYAIYQDKGQRAVEEFVYKYFPDLPWEPCIGCEDIEPRYKAICLVCGSVF